MLKTQDIELAKSGVDEHGARLVLASENLRAGTETHATAVENLAAHIALATRDLTASLDAATLTAAELHQDLRRSVRYVAAGIVAGILFSMACDWWAARDE